MRIFRSIFLTIVWIPTLLGVAAGFAMMVAVISEAKGAPQEAAGAAMAAAAVIIPYCLSRALTEIVDAFSRPGSDA